MSIKNPASNNEQLLRLAVMAVQQRTGLRCDDDTVTDFIRAPETAALAEMFLGAIETGLRPRTGRIVAATAIPDEVAPLPVADPVAPVSTGVTGGDATASTDAVDVPAPTLPAGVVNEAPAATPPDIAADTLSPASTESVTAAADSTPLHVIAETPADIDPDAIETATGSEPTADASTPAALAPVTPVVDAAAAAVEPAAATPPPAAEAASPTVPQVTAILSSATASQNSPPIRFQLPNAKVGQAFDGRPMPQTTRPLDIIGAVFPSDLGLSLDEADQRFVGTPLKSGEFLVEIQYRFRGEPENVVHFANTPLTVIPDPRLLWKDIPSDQAVPFWKPDRECARLEDGAARLVAASQRGRSHAHKGTCRDDDFFIDTSNGWRIGVVCDGAGSAKYSRQGAKQAAQAAGRYLAAALLADAELLAAAEQAPDGASAVTTAFGNAIYNVVAHAAYEAMKALHEQAARGGPDGLPLALSDLNTTLLIAVARPLGSRTIVGTYTVGDGAVGILSGGDKVTLGGVPDGGEFSGGTRFLANTYVTGDEVRERTRALVLDRVEAIVLMSDGVSDPKFKSDRALETREAWDTLMQEIAAETGFDRTAPGISEGLETRLLDWLGFWVPGEHDDRTIAIIW